MNKQDFSEQIRVREEELGEIEDVVEKYGAKIKGVSPLLRGNMITAFRHGIIECMNYLDQKAQIAKIKRDMKQAMIGE